MGTLLKAIRKELNFYRVHILFFTFTPLIFSGIFYASNGRFKISYIDCLFNCVSAMTVCGLATVDLSSLTNWQQAILFIQMCMGSPVTVSWVMVYLRKYYFAKKFEHIIEAAKSSDLEKEIRPWPQRIFSRKSGLTTVNEISRENSRSPTPEEEPRKKKGFMKKLRPDMIRRMDGPPQLVNPSGWISEGMHTPLSPIPSVEVPKLKLEKRSEPEPESSNDKPRRLTFSNTLASSPEPMTPEPPSSSPSTNSQLRPPLARRLSDPGRASPLPTSPITSSFPRSDTIAIGASFPRTQTIEFAPDVLPRRGRSERPHLIPEYESSIRSRRSARRASVHRQDSYRPASTVGRSIKHSGFGGFPMPHEIIKQLFSRFFPKLERKLTRTMTLPRTTTLASRHNSSAVGSIPAPYISFDAIVGRNSAFRQLSREQQDELGGVEYRALNALLWIVAVYHIGIQLIAFTVIAPYMAKSRWKADFLPPNLHRKLAPSWFSAFQTVSAYTNTGMSLVDQSMIPFQQAYPMIAFMAVLVLAGNTAFPIFLRFMIWVLSKVVNNKSRANETLHFLLDHPRRCFIYLFPSHQTWFLLTMVLTLNMTDWFFFMVLDIGNPAIESIALHTRFAIGFLQAIAVRAAGFGTVALSSLAPAVKVLYLIMMYISVYPIAMSVRSTNVYEEQSLGVFRDSDSDDEDDFEPHQGSRITVWSRYLAMHARKQLAFVFELVSAYGTVGLSLGIPDGNYSFSGAFRPLSKLIVCLVMIRGRHRGLPVAIDRAVLLPMEFAASRAATRDEAEEVGDVSGREKTHSVEGDMEWRMRRNARQQSIEEVSLSTGRRSAAFADGYRI
ncbi:Potassium transport protein [Mycena indigotica]|uniref:Potassium transport protein n=1 Tax=Mycena indigotica TaxID=2126181 RepID=A0A8H6TE45_9AGAR|nr:Potassium transport protein [Mycena indigotica]KAF7315082.1 Potassium transport protein [Mycena indigotica]